MTNPSVQKCPEPVVLPIIFVPGIMGSRLRKSSGKKEIVWDAEDSTSNAISNARKNAIEKRNALVGENGAPYDPSYLEVDYGEVRSRPNSYEKPYTGKPPIISPEIKAQSKQYHEEENAKSAYLNKLNPEHVKRGWGGLFQGSYLGFMEWLAYSAAQPGTNRKLPAGCQNVHYEVWAHPYNWTDSNLNSGKKLGDTVDKAYQETRQKYEGKGVKVLKPIIITHSMGGLVARAYTQIHGGAGKVHGVIHGALPCDGAPATYKRISAGFEDGTLLQGGPIVRHVLGADRQEATATAANMPGALELLPNQFHKGADGATNWLRCTGKDGNLLWSKPAADPYSEIYLNQTDWWRLIYKEYLNPMGSADEAFNSFQDILGKAMNFHAQLGPSAFHPNTRMFYGNDPGYLAWGHVEWRQTGKADDIPSNNMQKDNERGEMVFLKPIEFPNDGRPRRYDPTLASLDTFTRYEIQPQNTPGDGTVHTGSGLYVSGPMSVATKGGFEHQYAYAPNPPDIREMVAGWIYDMVEEQL